MEIERKFLVKELPTNYMDYRFDTIVQHYISLEPEVRIRSKNNKVFLLTIKSNGDMIRKEVEFVISKQQFNELSTMSIGSIYKSRYYVDRFELDVYLGLNGLMTVEIEFDSEIEANRFIPPNWFGAEVTSNKKFKNKNLAVNSL